MIMTTHFNQVGLLSCPLTSPSCI